MNIKVFDNVKRFCMILTILIMDIYDMAFNTIVFVLMILCKSPCEEISPAPESHIIV